MRFFNDLKVAYTSGHQENWTGRKTNVPHQYWHQEITMQHIADLSTKSSLEIGLIGYVCDEGVLRNEGRIGARKGPEHVRAKLGKLPLHTNKKISDFGDVICIDHNLEDCQIALSKTITKLINNGIFPIAIGGGHDIAYANFKGISEALKTSSKKKIGIVNFDAHFDLRPLATQPNSGTPFYQILTENKQASYFAVGIQQQANTKELFDIAAQHSVSIASNFECETFSDALKSKLNSFINQVDVIYLTIDLDGFSSAYAPGVSAPSPLGFSPNFIFKALDFLMASKKVISCDIAELNPAFDIDNTTSNLAARIVDFIVLNA